MSAGAGREIDDNVHDPPLRCARRRGQDCGSYGAWNGSSGCPYGPTGYEGPKTSFVTSPSLPDSAEVDFTGGLAPGGTAYFSLEGALTSAQLTARQGPLVGRYVALGDSFSSGEGDPPFAAGTNTTANECHRATQAYGPQVQAEQKIPDTNFTFHACSGAVMADFVANLPGGSGQYTDGAQLDTIAPASQPSTGTGLVTLSIGGNDAGFPFILRACVRGLGSGGPQCTVGSYTATVGSFHHTFYYTLDQAEMTAMNSAGDTLDTTVAQAVATAKAQGIDIQAIDARPDFEAHEICGSSPWLNALILNGRSPSPFSFHPNSSGQDDFAKLIEGSLPSIHRILY